MAEANDKKQPEVNAGEQTNAGDGDDAVVGAVTETKPVADDPFVGVDDIYKNYADETGKPFLAEEGDAAELEKAIVEREKLRSLDAAFPVAVVPPQPDADARKHIDKARADEHKLRLEQHPDLKKLK